MEGEKGASIAGTEHITCEDKVVHRIDVVAHDFLEKFGCSGSIRAWLVHETLLQRARKDPSCLRAAEFDLASLGHTVNKQLLA